MTAENKVAVIGDKSLPLSDICKLFGDVTFRTNSLKHMETFPTHIQHKLTNKYYEAVIDFCPLSFDTLTATALDNHIMCIYVYEHDPSKYASFEQALRDNAPAFGVFDSLVLVGISKTPLHFVDSLWSKARELALEYNMELLNVHVGDLLVEDNTVVDATVEELDEDEVRGTERLMDILNCVDWSSKTSITDTPSSSNAPQQELQPTQEQPTQDKEGTAAETNEQDDVTADASERDFLAQEAMLESFEKLLVQTKAVRNKKYKSDAERREAAANVALQLAKALGLEGDLDDLFNE